MKDGIMDIVMTELQDRNIYLCEKYAPYFVCSYACHEFNLHNQRKKIYWSGKSLPNMRMHCLFVAPPGFMKSHYLENMGGGEYGIFRDVGTKIGYKQSMTEPAFVGSVQSNNGSVRRIEGVAEQYKTGMCLIDEFSGITSAMKSQMNSQLDSQLLAVLDHGRVRKDLASGMISYDTNMTVWGGVQPARFDMTSGLGRRFSFLVFLPTPADNAKLRVAQHHARNVKPSHIHMKALWDEIKAFKNEIGKIRSVEFDDSVLEFYEKQNLYSYETSYFDRMLIGFEISTNGVRQEMNISASDKELLALLDQQRVWRRQVNVGIDYLAISSVMKRHPENKVHFNVLIEECAMFGWNHEQVAQLVKKMVDSGVIKRRGQVLELRI